ncbi:MAG: fumarylacetoacetate hydrolase family protein [Bacteroidales bacterium]|nr:fumarylacetoacetate hydrolase family protein [Lentimicrobiaceae bacterium]MDD5694833.1 fumarylacetoacetate hydrolase family protein [Bacteroidales bacterium]
MKIICIGRNYREHAKELSNPVPENPIFFLKPDTALLRGNRPFYYPDFSQDIHYETEIVVKICKTGKNIDPHEAHLHYDGLGIGIDLTARDLQQKAKEKGLPWTLAKGFDGAAPLSWFLTKKEFADITDIRFHLKKNGVMVQKGNTGEMIFPVCDLIAYISRFITLKPGDLIFTGTPAGVGPIRKGDCLEAYIEEKFMLRCMIR